MTNGLVSLDQNAVKQEIERQIAQISTNTQSMAHDHKLISAIESVTDDHLKTELLKKCVDAVSKNQGELNSAMIDDLNSRIRINELKVNHAIATDKQRNAIFNNRALILFAWCFPIIAGFAAIKFLDSFIFATFIIIVLYGVLIALYFSQANGLNTTWEAFTKNRRDL